MIIDRIQYKAVADDVLEKSQLVDALCREEPTAINLSQRVELMEGVMDSSIQIFLYNRRAYISNKPSFISRWQIRKIHKRIYQMHELYIECRHQLELIESRRAFSKATKRFEKDVMGD